MKSQGLIIIIIAAIGLTVVYLAERHTNTTTNTTATGAQLGVIGQLFQPGGLGSNLKIGV